MTPRAWYRFENSASDPTVADIYVVDIIGDWIDELINEFWGMKATLTAKAFVDQLSKLPDAVTKIRVHINSPGGDPFAAVNIANALRDQQLSKNRAVETIVDGLAASAASIIAMAGKTVRMADNGMLMIHNPWTVGVGEAKDMRKIADTLDAIRNTIIATYKWHSELDDAAIASLMDAESWFSAAEAKEKGFVTDVTEGLQAAASIDPRGVAGLKVPDKFRARVDALLKKEMPAPAVATSDEIFAAVAAAGFDIAFGQQLVAAKLPMLEVTARIATAKDERTARDTRATEIRALCATAKLPELADDYIAGGMSPEKVRAQLVTVTAKVAGGEIDNKIPDRDPAVSAKKTWDAAFARVKSKFAGARQ